MTNPQNKAEQVYIRVIEEHPSLLKLPIASDDLKIVVASAYLVGQCDGLAEMKETYDRATATWERK